MNMQQIVDDPALWGEFVKAYHIAGQYRPRVQFRKDLLNADHVYFYDDQIALWSYTASIPMTILIDAYTGFVHPDLKE